MSDFVRLRNASRRPLLVGAHLLLPGHTVDVERIVAEVACLRYPGELDVLAEDGFVNNLIQLAEVGAFAAADPPAPAEPEAPEASAANEETENGDLPQRPSPAPRRRGTGSRRDA